MGKKVKIVLKQKRKSQHYCDRKRCAQTYKNTRNKLPEHPAETVETYVAQTRAVAEVTGDDGNNSLLKAVGK